VTKAAITTFVSTDPLCISSFLYKMLDIRFHLKNLNLVQQIDRPKTNYINLIFQ
jgi:hypothetical protein